LVGVLVWVPKKIVCQPSSSVDLLPGAALSCSEN
jgi:hypothetical protein